MGELIDGRWPARRDRLQQPQLDPGADQRRDIQQIAGLAGQFAARASTASRADAGTSPIPA